MDAATRKNISIVCLCFSVLWFAFIALFELRYLIRVFRHQKTLHDVLGTIYEEQMEGISLALLFVYLIPGIFALVMYWRFKREH